MYTPYGSTGPLDKESDVKSTKMIDDPRPIHAVWDADGQVGATVGLNDVTAITYYEENGDMAPVFWFAVWKGDIITKRLNGAHMAVVRY